ncbi:MULTISPECIES: gliding motility-associated C-terminal domain-containing protein [unclassified Carboxylicivirga]|uniref:T9SS type B sorting domain-containing protein n=1 Tax=Carboxylicivirga TaxID=1628153 RepID=UPI003D3417CB
MPRYLVASRVFLFLLILSTGIPVYAQITSNAFYTETTQYGDGTQEDSIFFYTNIAGATLTAPLGGTYQWYRYAEASNSFEPIAGATMPSLTNITESGYRVDVDGQALYCWNFVPAAQVDSVGIPIESCNDVRVMAYTSNKILSYYRHRSDHSEVMVDYGYEWSSEPAGPANEQNDYTFRISAPTEDTDYSVVVGGKFSPAIPASSGAHFYTAMAVEAVMHYETEDVADNEATEGSAPMTVQFYGDEFEGEPLSKGHITEYKWTANETLMNYGARTPYTFQANGDYSVVLYVRNNDSECEAESEPLNFSITDMVVRVPNAFTPFSTPTQNDEFRVLYRSVNKFTMLIYNRWGRKVFQSNNPEVGWDGRIGGRKAEPGVYFYKIEAEGFNKDDKKIHLEGAVHLIVN